MSLFGFVDVFSRSCTNFFSDSHVSLIVFDQTDQTSLNEHSVYICICIYI